MLRMRSIGRRWCAGRRNDDTVSLFWVPGMGPNLVPAWNEVSPCKVLVGGCKIKDATLKWVV